MSLKYGFGGSRPNFVRDAQYSKVLKVCLTTEARTVKTNQDLGHNSIALLHAQLILPTEEADVQTFSASLCFDCTEFTSLLEKSTLKLH